MTIRAFAALAVLALLPGVTYAAITLHTSDFIADDSRTNFNGFEAIAPVDQIGVYTGGSYTEDGITVANFIDGSLLNNIWTSCVGQFGCFDPSHEGSRSWYPNVAGAGYTRITRADGSDFVDVGFIVGSGFGPSTTVNVYYELAENGVVVQSAQLNGYNNTPRYLGFGGGGFDEVRIRSGFGDGLNLQSPSNALAVDSIEAAGVVPEPVTWGVIMSGIVLLAARRMRSLR